MGLVSYTNIEDGQSVDANVFNSRYGDILAQVNGNLDSTNIRNGTLTRELFSNDAKLASWPVDSVYLSVTNVNPATALGGGTWVQIAQGRALVGVDPADTDFDEAEKTAGTKTVSLTSAQMPSHSHGRGSLATSSAGSHTHSLTAILDNNGSSNTNNALTSYPGANIRIANRSTNSAGAHTHSISGSTANAGSGQAHNNVQPSFALYIWKRVS